MEKELEFKDEREIKEYIKNLNFFEVTTLIEDLMKEKYLYPKEQQEPPKITITLEEFIQHFYIRRENQRGAIRDRKEYNKRISNAISRAMEEYSTYAKGIIQPQLPRDVVDAGDIIKEQDRQELFNAIKGESPIPKE